MRQLKITKSITNRESEALEKYLSEIGKEELLSADEEVELSAAVHHMAEVAIHVGEEHGFSLVCLALLEDAYGGERFAQLLCLVDDGARHGGLCAGGDGCQQ